jgi:acetyl coenzyme A synthetase (ADP forming)-like protein
MADSSLIPFFSPHGIVVIGASTSPEKLGYGVARNLIQCGYQGAVHFVSQKPGELFGRRLYTDLSQVPGPLDLAILIVPPQATPLTIEDCGRRGLKAAIIISSGFREVGPDGAALEQECLAKARSHGIRLLGPNCIGTIDTHLPLDTSFLPPPMPVRGPIGFISHSGAFCAAIVDWARGQGLGFSRIVSLGNHADMEEADVLAILGEDEHTHVIVLYMEGVSDGRRLVEIAREVMRRKPVIALKVGRFESGQRAAASHTGALAASDTAFEAAFEKAGILRADSAEQMFDWARALESYPSGLAARRSETHGIAILTNAGGPGVIAADALEKNALSLARLHEPAIKALLTVLPPAANVFNPVDMLASASPDTYAASLKILLADDNVEGVLVILPPPPMHKAKAVAERIIETIAAVPGGLRDGKPVVVALLGSTLIEEARSTFERAGIPTYPFPDRAASALGALVRRAELLTTETLGHESLIDSPWLPVSVVAASPQELLAAYGIETLPLKLARSLEEAESIAHEIGYPVVMKIASADILHKSDVGGVELNIKDDSSLHIAYTRLMERVRAVKPKARIEGVHLQRQIPMGQEVIVGAVRDPQFGPLMMFGSGGVEVEGLKDVAFALAALNRSEALQMIRRTWAGRKLAGFRHIPPADEECVVDVLVKLSHLILENEAMEEIEINPLRVLERGAVAVDVRIKMSVEENKA